MTFKIAERRKIILRITALSAILFLALESSNMAMATEQSKSSKQIEAVLSAQCDAWNKGSLDEFMKGYLQSDNTSYTSGGTEVWGYEALQERYQKKYGNSPETMGKVKFSDLKIIDLGSKNALVIGHWHLDKPDSTNLDGTFSLVLVLTKNGWKIMHDHTSLAEKQK